MELTTWIVPQVKIRGPNRSVHPAGYGTDPWAPTVWTVLAALLIFGSSGAGLALDRVRVETGVDKAEAALGVSGAGVIVAILDRGIDWESNDFRDSDGRTRIAYIFDLSDDAGAGDEENGYGRGTIYTRRQIDRALAAGTTLATRDAIGHGTTTTGIAAGNGRNSPDRKYRGMAPNATIIAVKVVAGEGSDEPDFWDYSALPVAIDFVVDKARELSMPVVMLLNLGSIGGPTDGTSALARKIDETVGPDHPGVVFVTGTGDDGIPSKTQNRAVGDVPNGGTLDLRFALDTGAGTLEVWYDRNQGLDVSFITPNGMLGPYPASQFEAAGVGVHAWHHRGGDDFYGATNSKRLLFVRFDGGAGAGDYTLRLDHAGGSAGAGIHFDASLNTPFGRSGRFLNHVTPGSIWDGATAFRNVAPNSYVIRTEWTDIDGVDRRLVGEGDVGELWTGSSVGPTVDGRVGVDVSAPGDRIVTTYAPQSFWATYRNNLIVDGGGLYGMAGAVSAAAPVVTGIIALMLEVDPTLDAGSVKRILQETARTDEFTGQTPNTRWGYGKVDAFEALMAVRHESANGETNRLIAVTVEVAGDGQRTHRHGSGCRSGSPNEPAPRRTGPDIERDIPSTVETKGILLIRTPRPHGAGRPNERDRARSEHADATRKRPSNSPSPSRT
ncbi:MAG: S8 family serine peptidase [Acidobacteria bacterium]|nr:S8 family serine peptidase [Acidobacteriota bacterium]